MSSSAFGTASVLSNSCSCLYEQRSQKINKNDSHFLHLFGEGEKLKVISGGKSGGIYARSYKHFFDNTKASELQQVLPDSNSWLTAFVHDTINNEFLIGNRDGTVHIYSPSMKSKKLHLSHIRQIVLHTGSAHNAEQLQPDHSTAPGSDTPASILSEASSSCSDSPKSSLHTQHFLSRIQAITTLKLQSDKVITAIVQNNHLVLAHRDTSSTSIYKIPRMLDIKGIDDGIIGSLNRGGITLYAVGEDAHTDTQQLAIKEFYTRHRRSYVPNHALPSEWPLLPNWKPSRDSQQVKTLTVVPLPDGKSLGACQSDGSFTVFDLNTTDYTDITDVVPWVLNQYHNTSYASRRVWSAVLPDPQNSPDVLLAAGDAPQIALLDLRTQKLATKFFVKGHVGRISAMVVPMVNNIIATIDPQIVTSTGTEAVGFDLRLAQNAGGHSTRQVHTDLCQTPDSIASCSLQGDD